MDAEQRLRELVAKYSPEGIDGLPEAILQVGVPLLLRLFEAHDAFTQAHDAVQAAAKAFAAHHGVKSIAIH